MPGPDAALALTADDIRQLTTWVRAGTTPQRLVRRARVSLGSAAGLGSRALARQERMSRTTVRRWLGRFATQRCAGLRDRPGRGRPKTLTPATRALVVALACERPADRAVALRRYSLNELTVEVANRLPSEEVAPSRTAVWHVLANDALRSWRYRSWITARIHTFWSGTDRCSTCTLASGRADHSGRTNTSSAPMRRPAFRSDAVYIRR